MIAFAPGRVNLIGEHTDYNGGLALPFAIEQGVTVTAEATALPSGGTRLIRAVYAELERTGITPPPARIEISSTLPSGAGLGSSGAVGVALVLALGALGASPMLRLLEVAELASRAEHALGAETGLLDQLTSLHGTPGHALLIDFASLDVTPVPFDLHGYRLVVLHSGERHANARSGYNQRREECRAGMPSRLWHVASENERVRHAVAALESGDIAALGPLLDASHVSLRDEFEVSTPAVEAARQRLLRAGAIGARIHGGGFGGGVLGLFPPDVPLPDRALEVTPSGGARLETAAD